MTDISYTFPIKIELKKPFYDKRFAIIDVKKRKHLESEIVTGEPKRPHIFLLSQDCPPETALRSGLLLIYMVADEFPTVSFIWGTRDGQELPLSNPFDFSCRHPQYSASAKEFPFLPQDLFGLFGKSPEADRLRLAAEHWIRALTTDDDASRLDHLDTVIKLTSINSGNDISHLKPLDIKAKMRYAYRLLKDYESYVASSGPQLIGIETNHKQS